MFLFVLRDDLVHNTIYEYFSKVNGMALEKKLHLQLTLSEQLTQFDLRESNLWIDYSRMLCKPNIVIRDKVKFSVKCQSPLCEHRHIARQANPR